MNCAQVVLMRVSLGGRCVVRGSNVDLHSIDLREECGAGEGSKGGSWADNSPDVKRLTSAPVLNQRVLKI
ncbi:hypothetical protein NDU88_003659 [Pleurodeles waltl]|uniref:Uncharacterized protein n=1 Tax=Pleurodeles waltl TaxID=8319 RepID=A0AAV7M411_PLEWA|nr:hypothetical protein NDU88_003659 [Pleurodeles waltl]